MATSAIVRPGRRRLRLWMAIFFLALAVPTAVLVIHAFGQLKWEAFHQQRQLAEALAARIDGELSRLVETEEARSFADYGFLVVAGDPAANFLQRSPLSTFPVQSRVPGLVGHFQVDAQGRFSTPLLPGTGEPASRYGVDAADRSGRLDLEARIRAILSENRLVEGRQPRKHAAASVAAVAGRRATPAQEPPASPSIAGKASTDRLSRSMAPQSAQRRRDADAVASAAGENNERATAQPTPTLADASPPSAAQSLASTRTDDAALRPAFEADEKAPVEAQAAFDRLKAAPARPQVKKRSAPGSFGRVEELELFSRRYEQREDEPRPAPLEERTHEATPQAMSTRAARKERSALPEAEGAAAIGAGRRILTFESELDPFEFSLLDSGHFVLFRKVWRDGERFIQGALIEQRAFFEGVLGRAFHASALATTSKLAAAWDGDLLWAMGAASERYVLTSTEELAGALLHRERLSAPFADLELVFTVARLPAGPGASVVAWVAAVIAIVLCGGLALMYRLGARQLDLARQQQDFVSAVSHELRTPLTSIRMYAEMLKEGWASEEKKRSYYAYIFDESERLSRLISNVLQLARMTRNEFEVDTHPVPVATLMDGIASKVSSHAERAGFALDLECDPAIRSARVTVDEDAFSQIVINLVDNALKFSAQSTHKRVEIRCRPGTGRRAVFSVRDFGPGVARDQMRKIFRLFYRPAGELTRETVGTGIGLALVNELARSMGASVDVANAEPGAVFSLSLALTSTDNEPDVAHP